MRSKEHNNVLHTQERMTRRFLKQQTPQCQSSCRPQEASELALKITRTMTKPLDAPKLT